MVTETRPSPAGVGSETEEVVAPEEATTETPTEEQADQPRDLAREMASRHIVAAVERDADITLSPEQREILVNHYLTGTLNEIDRKTESLLGRYQKKLLKAEGQGGAMRIQERSRFTKFLDKYLPAAKQIATTSAVSFGARTLLHLIPGLGYFAGTLAGAAVGGCFGKKRAEEKMEEQSFGYQGLVGEFNRLANDQTIPEAQQTALTFLETTLQRGLFKGNLSETLQMMVFYRAQADEIGNMSQESINLGIFQSAEFQIAVKAACNKAGITGMKKGMLIGGGIGLASDAIAFVGHWLRTEHARDAYLEGHYGRGNEITVTDGPEIRMDHSPQVNPLDPNLANQGVHLEMTEYGNNLSEAVKRGIEAKDFVVPQDYLTEMAKQGYTDEQAINQFIYNFNFATPIEGHDWVADGLSRHFNIDGLKHLVENSAQTAPDGSFDYHNFAQTLGNADNFLSNQYPSIGVDYVVHDPVPFKESLLYQDAMADAAKHSGEGWRSILHGGLMGVGIGAATEKSAKNIASTGGNKNGDSAASTPSAAPSGGGEAGDRPDPTEQEGGGGDTGEDDGEETQEEDPNIELEDATPINWEERFQENYHAFATSANEALVATTQKDWQAMEEKDRTAIIGLFEFIKNYSTREKRFEIKVEYLGETFKVEQAPSADSPKLSLKDSSNNAKEIDFTAKLDVWPTILVEEKPNPDETGEIAQNMINATTINHAFSTAKTLEQEIKIEIERKQVQGKGRGARMTPKKVFADDPGDGILEIIGVDWENGKIKILPPSGKVVEVGEEAIENMAKLKTYKWK